MDKTKQKRKTYNTGILNVLSEKFGYTEDYIRKSLRGDRTGIMPDKLKKEYKILEKDANALEKESKKNLQEKANNLN